MALRSAGSARIDRKLHLVLSTGALLLSLSVAARAAAQGTGGCRPDTTTIFKRLAVGMSVDPDLDSTGRALATTVAADIAGFIEPPAHVTMDKLRGPSEWKDATGSYQSEGLLSIGQLVLDLHQTGRVQHVALDPGTGSLEVDRALLAGVAAADSNGVFPQAGTDTRVARRQIRLWILTAASPLSTWATPLFMVAGRVPANATSAMVQIQSAPTYPQALLAKGVAGDAYIAFEVDSQGQVPEASIRVLSADDSAFIQPAEQSIRESRFAAATQGGCPVRSTLRQRVRFRAPATASLASASATASTDSASLAATARWVANDLPKLTTAHVVVEVAAQIGGTDVGSVRTRVIRAKLEHCVLELERLFDAEAAGSSTPLRLWQTVPLKYVDPGSFAIQQRPAQGSSLATITSPLWRVVLALQDGSIQTDADRSGRHATTNDSDLDLIVSSREAGLEIISHLQAAVAACR